MLNLSLIKNTLEQLRVEASQQALAPVSIAVVDALGNLLYLERWEGAPARTVRIAQAKAYTATRMQCSTQSFHQRLLRESLQLQSFMDDQLCAMPGGVLIHAASTIVGGVGVSGRAIGLDHELAEGIAALLAKA